MLNFCKNEDCPSSNELLQFQNGDLAATRGREIKKHLTDCEFCAAEVDFYSRYPQAEGVAEAAEIPAPLYELAESLLKNKHTDQTWLDKIWPKAENLAVEKN